MKRFYRILPVIALAALTTTTFTQCKKSDGTDKLLSVSESDSCQASGLRVAYINTDTLLEKYELAKKLNDEILKKDETMRANVNERSKSLEKDVSEFQRKYNNKAFLSQERAEQEYQRINNRQQELQEYVQRMEIEAMQNRQKVIQVVTDSIQNYIKSEIKGKYDIVLNNAGTLHVTDKIDITEEVVKGLNARYKEK